MEASVGEVASPQALDGVSRRSLKLMKGPLSYIDVFIKAMPDLWSLTNPKGWIPLVVAENKLGNDKVLEKLGKVRNYPTWVMNYGGFKGTHQLQSALCGLMNRTFVKKPVLEPDNMCILSGCSGVLDNLFYCLADENASVLIPAPYYPAFDNDLEAKANLVPVPFLLDESRVTEQLDELKAACVKKGQPVRVLLITNPNNPLGTIYREKVVRVMLRWCVRNHVHYVSDEIYALSVYKPEGHPFNSAFSLANDFVVSEEFSQEEVDKWVHLVYGLSKDWCASGLRVGLVYSNNRDLQRALMTLAGFSGVSNHTQHALAEVLADVTWTSQFVAANARALEHSYDVLTEALHDAGIPYVHAVAGMFVWIDLREFLPKPTWEGEDALWQHICDTCKVILTPGKACHAPAPGYFRLCFAWVSDAALVAAVKRIKAVLGQSSCTII